EDFLQFVPIHSTVGLELANTIISTLTGLGINLKYLRGHGYDGAANMRSVFRGVQAIIMQKHPKAIYTHLSAKRSYILRQKLEPKAFSGLKKFCKTRWVERHESILIFVEGFYEIVCALEEIMSEDNNKVVASLHKSLFCNTAIESVKETTQKLEDIRNEETFTEIYHQACEIAISFYEEDLVIENYKLLENEFEFWKQKWSSEKNCIPKNALGTLPKCPEELFPNINVFLKILSILPVSTASVERSFSTLKIIKPYLRNTTGETRLNGLALMNIYRDLHIDSEVIINMFASKKERRLDFKL
ncbi:52 kDa repressor of the inhibitor of the protein kinase-like, partial [Aphis craccivora]